VGRIDGSLGRNNVKLVIDGKTPSKKNSRNIFVRNGRIVNIPNKLYKEWQEYAVLQLKKQFKGYQIAEYPIAIDVIVYYGTKHRHDLDNALGSIMDVLVDAEVIVDDDVSHISQITVQHGGLDREKPRVEVYLED
jgi:Holliday junction resolvase RusA-like endonuclease